MAYLRRVVSRSGGMERFQQASLSCLVAASAILADVQESTASLAGEWQDND